MLLVTTGHKNAMSGYSTKFWYVKLLIKIAFKNGANLEVSGASWA